MRASAGRAVRARTRRTGRAASAVLAAAIGVGVLGSCGGDPAGTGTGPAGTDAAALEERLSELEDRVRVLDDRVAALEEGPDAEEQPDAGGQPEEDRPGGGGSAVLGNGEALIGQGVTVTGEVVGPITVADVGASYRVAGGTGDRILVVMATPPAALEAGDDVEVSGRVVRVAQDSFELDFGIAADQLFQDPAAFFADFEGDLAISADNLEVVGGQAG